MQKQHDFMREAIRLANESVTSGGGPFGCVVVKNGKIVGLGSNAVTSTNDPTAHAEVVAIRDACKNLKNFQLEGCEVYASCEPCPMCLGAIYWARPAKLYFACTKNDAAEINFDDDFIYEEIKLPYKNRTLETHHILREEGLTVFDAWRSNLDKVEY